MKIDLEHFYDFIFLTEEQFLSCYNYMTKEEVHDLYVQYKNIPQEQRQLIILELANNIIKEKRFI